MVSRPDQLVLGVRLRDSSVFASYFAGPNRVAVDALLATQGSAGPTCLWLQGAKGTGKTHLLQALCAQAGERGAGSAYLPLAESSRTGPELLQGFGELACVCVDDLDVIVGQRDWELALFNLYRELDEHRGRLVISSTATAVASGIELRDLSSRLSGGLVLTLHALNETEQCAALQLRAQLRGFDLPEETIQYLLRRLPRDTHSLFAFLDELDEASFVAQRRLTIPFVREVLESKATR